MAYLESRRVVHRALCGDTVLIDNMGNDVRLTGFGLTRDIYQNDSYIAQSGVSSTAFTTVVKGRDHPLPLHATAATSQIVRDDTVKLYFLSVEALEDGQFSHASDCYAFGSLMYEVFNNGQHMFSSLPPGQIANAIRQHRLPALPSTGPCLRQLYDSCTLAKASNRPLLSNVFTRLLTMEEDKIEAAPFIANPNVALRGRKLLANGITYASIGDSTGEDGKWQAVFVDRQQLEAMAK